MAPKQPTAGPSRLKTAVAQSPPPRPAVTAFNSERTLFAAAIPVLGSADKLCIWDVTADRMLAEHEIEGAQKISTVCWTFHSTTSSSKKKRKKSTASAGDEVVAVTTEGSRLILFSPERNEVVQSVDLPSKPTASTSSSHGMVISTSQSLLIFPSSSSSFTTVPLPPNTTPPTALCILPTSTSNTLHILVASMTVLSLHVELKSSKVTFTSSPIPVSTSSVTSLTSLPVSDQGASFLVISDDDRTVSQYTLPSPTSKASLSYRYTSPTLSPAHSLALSSQLLAVLYQSGEVSLFRLPLQLDLVRPKSDSKPSIVKLVEGKDERPARLCGLVFAATEDNESPRALNCGRMAGGGKVQWRRAEYGDSGEDDIRPSTVVKVDAQDLVNGSATTNNLSTQRFTAPQTIVEAPPPETADSRPELPTDVDMADLTLGERLLAVPNGPTQPNGDGKPAQTDRTINGPVNAASLTRLLVQALHTSDPALLTLCLTHRDPVLIRNTIRKMPASMALPLLKACVERLGQGKRATKRGGGRGSAQNEQQGRGTVEWVKGVLVERGPILMTMPSLPVHLGQLSTLLNTRMQLYQPLLSLSGRLDLALAQIQMRRLAAEQIKVDGAGEGEKYVEGESDEEIIEEDEEGEVEDVDMRGMESDEDLEDEDDDEEDDDEDDEDDEDPLDSGSEEGFLDLEAEEGSEEEESDSEED